MKYSMVFTNDTLKLLDTPPQQIVLVGYGMGGYVLKVVANNLPICLDMKL